MHFFWVAQTQIQNTQNSQYHTLQQIHSYVAGFWWWSDDKTWTSTSPQNGSLTDFDGYHGADLSFRRAYAPVNR